MRFAAPTLLSPGRGEGHALKFAAAQNLFKYQSGRVIALGRIMLAALFLLAIWLDDSQPAQAPAQTYLLLVAYLAFAVAIAAATWRNWWLDARLAAPTHLADMAMFTVIVFSTNGYTSPFFLFFILPLLSAAIRWGWRETALTALGLVLLYLTAGLLVAASETFELQRFIVRSGHLVILSALLIWFGIHQRRGGLPLRLDEVDYGLAGDRDPLEVALRQSMGLAGAHSGLLLMRFSGAAAFAGPHITRAGVDSASVERPLVREPSFSGSMLFDVARDRALTVTARGRRRLARASAVLDPVDAARLALTEGLIAKVRIGTAEGWLILEDLPALSADHVELGRELGQVAGAILERDALLEAVGEGAAARMRLSLARDVHDSIVQFLAGAAMRIEAIMRAARSGAPVDSDLQELKQLIGAEQRDIRGFVAALRRDRELELAEVVEELRSLATRLGQQWSIDCRVNAAGGAVAIPIRVHLDLQQLLREAVANAVRHGGADCITVGLSVENDLLRLEVEDNGKGFAHSADGAVDGPSVQPWSLKERVERADGSMTLVSDPGCTSLSISLPLGAAP